MARIQECHDLQRYRQALETLRDYQPLSRLSDWRDLILVGRILEKYGSTRTSKVLFWRAWRQERHSLQTVSYLASYLDESYSPWHAWRLLESMNEPVDESPRNRALYWGQYAKVFLSLRDFSEAGRYVELVREHDPEHPYYLVLQGTRLELMDEREAALEKYGEALHLQPFYLGGVQCKAHLLNHLGQTEEAISLLQESSLHGESLLIPLHLMSILRELNRPEEALRVLDDAYQDFPWLPSDLDRILRLNRAHLMLDLDRFDEAIALFEESNAPGLDRFVERIRRMPSEAKRVQLDIPFVRQNFKTCAPATLAMISNHFGEGFDHLELARDITYDGTPDSAERLWIEARGWSARECSLDRSSLKSFIDAGMPAAVTTIGIDSAHMQAVVGYDEREDTVLIRDPNTRSILRWSAAELFEEGESPLRCLLIAPPDRADELNRLELTDSDLWDIRFRVRASIIDRRLKDAEAALEEMEAQAPGHAVTLDAAFGLAAARNDLLELLSVLDAQLGLFPKLAHAIATKFRVLQRLSRQKDARDFLAQLSESVFKDPKLLEVLLQVLGGEGMNNEKRVVRSLKDNARNPGAYAALANVLPVTERAEEHLFAARAAATLDDYNENAAQAYFYSAWTGRNADKALEWLKSRITRRAEKKDSQSWITLYSALKFLNRHDEAEALFDQALDEFPDEIAFGFFAASEYAEKGQLDKAEKMLSRDDLRQDRIGWVRCQSQLMLIQGRFDESLDIWKALINEGVCVEEATDMAAKLTQRLQGEKAALEFLQEALAKRPDSYVLMPMLIALLRDQNENASREHLNKFLEHNPDDVWALREVSLHYLGQKKYDEAFRYAGMADEAAPFVPETKVLLAQIYFQARNYDKTYQMLKEAIRLNVCVDGAVGIYYDAAPTLEQRRELLELLEEEIVKQTDSGPAIDTWRQLLFRIEREGVVDERMHRLFGRRSDLPDAWTNMAVYYVSSGRPKDALELLEEARSLFPFVLNNYFVAAAAHRLLVQHDEEISLLQTALRLQPNADVAYEQLSDALCKQSRYDEAIELLENAQRRNPLYAGFQLALADAYNFRGDREQAMETQEKALRLDPHNGSGWDVYWGLAKESGQERSVIEFAEQLVSEKPGDAARLFDLARLHLVSNRTRDAKTCLRRAIAAEPNNTACVDLLADLLCGENRANDAIELCRKWTGGNIDRVVIRRREAICWGRQGNLPRAEKILKEILGDNPRDLETLFWLARCYEAG